MSTRLSTRPFNNNYILIIIQVLNFRLDWLVIIIYTGRENCRNNTEVKSLIIGYQGIIFTKAQI